MKAHLSTFLVALFLLLFAAQVNYVSAQNDEERTRLYTEYIQEKDPEIRCARAKEFLEKFPDVDDYWKRGPRQFVKNCELRKTYYKCREADKTFFASPSSKTLNEATAACDAWLDKSSQPDVYYTTRLALVTGYGILAGFYTDTNRCFSYAEKALQLLAPEQPYKHWRPEDWHSFRRENIGRLLQYQGLCNLRQEKPDAEAAILYLTKAAEAREGPAFRDVNTYLLRAEANNILFSRLDAEYNALPTDSGKERALLAQIYPIVDNLMADYARTVVLAGNNPATKTIRNNAEENLHYFSKVRNPNVAVLLDTYKKEFGIK